MLFSFRWLRRCWVCWVLPCFCGVSCASLCNFLIFKLLFSATFFLKRCTDILKAACTRSDRAGGVGRAPQATCQLFRLCAAGQRLGLVGGLKLERRSFFCHYKKDRWAASWEDSFEKALFQHWQGNLVSPSKSEILVLLSDERIWSYSGFHEVVLPESRVHLRCACWWFIRVWIKSQ